jgi:folylpolyglutamate synthase/dihydropteroate synthase
MAAVPGVLERLTHDAQLVLDVAKTAAAMRAESVDHVMGNVVQQGT